MATLAGSQSFQDSETTMTEITVTKATTTEGISKELQNASEDVVVKVVNAETEAAISGIVVEIGSVKGTTNGEGKAALKVTPGEYALVVNPGGKAHFSEVKVETVTIGEQKWELTVTLSSSATIKGTLTDKVTKAGISGITVSATGHPIFTVEGVVNVSQGYWNEITISGEHSRIRVGDEIQRDGIARGTTVTEVDIVASSTVLHIAGVGVQQSTKPPIPATFTIVQPLVTLTTETNSEGKYELGGVPEGKYSVTFSGHDYEPESY